MTTHIKALTYAPKIDGVRSGSIRQTIRPVGRRSVREGDHILFHSWSGKPYRSAWSWRMVVHVLSVRDVWIVRDGIVFPLIDCAMPWSHPYMAAVARMDGIEPPTGEALGAYLNARYDLSVPRAFQIINW